MSGFELLKVFLHSYVNQNLFFLLSNSWDSHIAQENGKKGLKNNTKNLESYHEVINITNFNYCIFTQWLAQQATNIKCYFYPYIVDSCWSQEYYASEMKRVEEQSTLFASSFLYYYLLSTKEKTTSRK